MTPAKARSMLAQAEKALAKSTAAFEAAAQKRLQDSQLVGLLRKLADPEAAIVGDGKLSDMPKPNGGRGTEEEQLEAGRKIIVVEENAK